MKKNTTITLETDDLETLRKIAKKMKMSVSEIVRSALRSKYSGFL